MKKPLPKPVWFILVSYLFVLASHYILLTEPISRDWIQRNTVELNEEQDFIFRKFLGLKYFIVPDSMHFTKPPYYYTHLDTIYYWRRANHSLRFRACAENSDLCSPGVSYTHDPRSEEYFRYLYQTIFEDPETQHMLRCGNGIIAIIDRTITDTKDKSLSFSTINGFYIVSGVQQDSMNLWLDECEHDWSNFSIALD